MDDVIYGKLLYQRGGKVEIYQGHLNSIKQDICIKILYCDAISEANELLQETYNMMRFKDVPNIIKIYKSDLSQAKNKIFVRVLMEYFPNGDLKNLINSRFPNNYWEESELLTYLTQVSEVFALLESKNVAHRDIKPENIFVSNDKTRLIVGDLGNTKEILEELSRSIAGTPLYLSPELRIAYIEHLKGVDIKNFQHNPFKSDMYSLGLTFLYMASLKENSDMIQVSDLDNKVTLKIHELNYSLRFKDILKKMLSLDKEQRYSFHELRDCLLGTNLKNKYQNYGSLQASRSTNKLNQPTEYSNKSLASKRELYISKDQPFNNIGQPFNNIGQLYNSVGQPNNSVGQPYNSVGQPYNSVGQPYNSVGQPYNSVV
ncbi:hypothetical protein SteCoe_35971 [Stentor coeruleus]|uniref:Protein kinase domain-containing protein n=1 Tax=Stentor coeruleus TaxID=5963 RepID=A0A1R2ARG0_9CILI|nr:hypothetical protein SteCoe_35971 [Stentor coeruleus]